MNRPAPIPLRPDRYALELDHHRSLIRAATAVAMGPISRRAPADILRASWPDDTSAALVLRAATTPTTTASAPALSIDAFSPVASSQRSMV